MAYPEDEPLVITKRNGASSHEKTWTKFKDNITK
jgi:hypothetical protein